MKPVLICLLINLLIVGCSKDEEPSALPLTQVAYTDYQGNVFDQDNTYFDTKTTSLTNTTYYTSIDTTADNASVNWLFAARIDEQDSVRVNWSVNNVAQIKNITHRKLWDGAAKKWTVYNTVAIPLSNLSGSIPITASAFFLKSGKNLTRQTQLTVNQTKLTYDFGRVNFGMNKEQVKANETKRLGVKMGNSEYWQEPLPTQAIIGKTATQADMITGYEFKNDQLVSISESAPASGPAPTSLIGLVKKLRIPRVPELTFDQITRKWSVGNEQTWTNGKLRFRLHYKDVQIGPSQITSRLAVTYTAY